MAGLDPHTPAWATPRTVGFATTALVAATLAFALVMLFSLAPTPVEPVLGAITGAFALVAVRWALRDPDRITRRCLKAFALAGAATGAVNVVVLFCAEVIAGKRTPGSYLGFLVFLGIVLGAPSGALLGLLLSRLGRSIATSETMRDLDRPDVALLTCAVWLCVVGGLTGFFLAMGGNARVLVGLLTLAASLVASSSLIARDARRLGFLSRVRAGEDQSWELRSATAEETLALPRYVHDPSNAPRDAVLAPRVNEGSPFRATALREPVAAIDATTTVAQSRVRRRIVAAGAIAIASSGLLAGASLVYARMRIYGGSPSSTTPLKVDPLEGEAISIAQANGGTCARMRDSAVRCWGNNAQRFLGSTHLLRVPQPLENVRGVRQLALGFAHACAVERDESIICWGNGAEGQLGAGPVAEPQRSPVRVPIDGVAELALGFWWSCARRTDGTVWCWGRDPTTGLAERLSLDKPTRVENVDGAIGIASSDHHVCTLRADSQVVCWGANTAAQLGRPYAEGSLPASVKGTPPKAVSVAAGPSSSCVLDGDGVPWCWGNWGTPLDEANAGNTHDVRMLPRPIEGLRGVRQLALGRNFTCALLSSGEVSCLGTNGWGQLGDGTTTSRFSGAVVPGLTGVEQIAGDADSVCAMKRDGSVWCWGF